MLLFGLWTCESALSAEPFCTVSSQDAQSLPASDPYDKHSVRKLERLAKKGDARAMNSLGIRYGTGKGVPLDSARSFKYYLSAAEHGFPGAQANLAYMYQHGEGTEKNPELAFSWAKKSAETGDARGLEFMGYMLGTGFGVHQDRTEAAYCYLLAARRGNVAAQEVLATLYSGGIGIPVDREAAALWRSRAREAYESNRPWMDPTPDPPMPEAWKAPFDYVADIPATTRLTTAAYTFDVSLDALAAPAAQWQHYTGRDGASATVLRTGLPGYETVVVSVMPKEELLAGVNLLAAARRLQPNSRFEPVPRKKLCVRSVNNQPVRVGDSLSGIFAYCVRPRDRMIYELATTWKSLTVQVGGSGTAGQPGPPDLRKTMSKVLGSFAFN